VQHKANWSIFYEHIGS